MWVNIGSSNGFLTDGIKPLPGLMLSSHWCGSMAFTLEWLRSERRSHISMQLVWKIYFEFSPTSPKGRLLNSSPHSDAYMRQWIFMVPSHYWIQCRVIVNWNLGNKPQRNSIHENASENTDCEMGAIQFRGQWVNIMRVNFIYVSNQRTVSCIWVAVHVSGPCRVKHP